MDINYQNMSDLRQMVNMSFKKAFNAAQQTLPQSIYRTYKVDTESIRFPYLKQFGGRMRKWVGSRLIHSIQSGSIAYNVEDYEFTFGIKANDVKDDKIGLYAESTQTTAETAAQLPIDLAVDIINNAATEKWNADGTTFFGTTRKFGKNPIVNKGALPLTKENLRTVISIMEQYKGEGDKSLKVKPTVLLHGPRLKWVAKGILETEFEEDGSGNRNQMFKIVDDVQLDDMEGNNWMILGECMGIRAIGYFEREAPDHIVIMDSPKDEHVFKNGEFLYGANARATAGFLFPQLAYLNVVSA